ncbi:MAG: hypothetical protein IKP99_04740 [Bacteroidales bacterium]|nr:hypothetical protein [Bacteroidales bacterium]
MNFKLTTKATGLIYTTILSFVVSLLIAGSNPLFNLSRNFTSPDGDALKDFYNTYYHVKYDTSLVENNSMNYPYGDHYTYTGTQWYISAPLQFFKRYLGLDFSQYVLVLINLFIYTSIIACSIFLYLLLKELGIKQIIAVLSAIAITYLSPQMDRVSAHLTLSYAFIIPCALYLFLRWFKTYQWGYSIFIAFLTFFSGLVHPYYIFFLAAIWVFVCGYVFFCQSDRDKIQTVFHAVVQFIVPFILFMILTKIGDDPEDRTAIPWGFSVYKGMPQGLLTPVGRDYWNTDIEWESYSFIGFVALIALVIVAFTFVQKIVRLRWRDLLQITDNTFLSILFWSAIALTIFSFGRPLDKMPQYYLNYLGPLAQLRATGRFLWLMYYVANIIAVYILASYSEKFSRTVKLIILCVVCFIYTFDIYTFNKHRNFTNEKPLLTDYENSQPENAWVSQIDVSKYQSILPLPMYSLGTEHIWIEPKAGMFEKSVYVSMKTGLPLHSLYASRSRIQQAYKNISLCQAPYMPYEILRDMDSTRAILLLTPTDLQELNENEKRLVSYSDTLFSQNGIVFYSIYPARLQELQQQFCAVEKERYRQIHRYEIAENVYCDDSTKNVFVETWDNTTTATCFQGVGAKECKSNEWNVLFDGKAPIQTSDTVEISFMVSDYKNDFVGRTIVEIFVSNEQGESTFYCWTDLFQALDNIFFTWGKVSFIVPEIHSGDNIKISLRNDLLKPSQSFCVDNLVIKPIRTNILNEESPVSTMNNNVIMQ